MKKKAHKLCRMIKNIIFKQGKEIAKRGQEKTGIAGVVMQTTNPYFDSIV